MYLNSFYQKWFDAAHMWIFLSKVLSFAEENYSEWKMKFGLVRFQDKSPSNLHKDQTHTLNCTKPYNSIKMHNLKKDISIFIYLPALDIYVARVMFVYICLIFDFVFLRMFGFGSFYSFDWVHVQCNCLLKTLTLFNVHMYN